MTPERRADLRRHFQFHSNVTGLEMLDWGEKVDRALRALMTFPGVRDLFAPEDSLGSVWRQANEALADAGAGGE